MRIIGGTYRSRRLRTLAGSATRPTSDRLRETLFNIIGPRVRDSRFLDVCAGSGAVGIEALSRGARAAVFIEQSRAACAIIQANLEALGIAPCAIIINRDARATLNQLAAESSRFNIIFFDPPYASDIYEPVMPALADDALLADEGLVVVEHHAKTPPAREYGKLKIYREVKQGESALAFYRRDAG